MSDGKTGPTEAGVIAELARKALGEAAVIAGPAGRHFLVTPDGYEASEIKQQDWESLPSPFLTDQTVTVQTTDSLVDYVNRFKTDDTVLFADIASNVILGVIDYHGPDKAARLRHRVGMALPYSEEWKTWTSQSGKLTDQLSFARFLEENAVDVVAPAGADLLEVCRDLQALRNVDFRKAVRTHMEAESFEYVVDETVRTSGQGVDIPTKFELSVPVYFGGACTTLFAFLRFKLDPPALVLGFQLHRAEHVRQAVFKQVVLDVADRTERPVVFGKPSGSF